MGVVTRRADHATIEKDVRRTYSRRTDVTLEPRMRPPGKPQPTHLFTLERRVRVLALRQMGLTYRRIVEVMQHDVAWHGRLPSSYNARKAHDDVMASVVQQRAELDESVQVVRQQELDRLDRMLLGVWARAQSGDDRAIASVLAIMTRRARYLPGLEAPQTVAPMPAPVETSMPPEASANVAHALAQYGLYYQQHGNGLVTEANAGCHGTDR